MPAFRRDALAPIEQKRPIDESSWPGLQRQPKDRGVNNGICFMKSHGRKQMGDAAPDQIDVEVGLALRRARLHRRLSQTDLGNALGLSFQQIQKYERGANRVSASMLVKAARFLNISASDLLPQEDAPPSPSFVRRFTEARGVETLVDAYCNLPDAAQRRAVLDLVLAMAPSSIGED